MVVSQDGSVVLEKVQQMRHLFEVGRYVRIVAGKVCIVELDVDDMCDLAMGGIERTSRSLDGRGSQQIENYSQQYAEKNADPGQSLRLFFADFRRKDAHGTTSLQMWGTAKWRYDLYSVARRGLGQHTMNFV